MRGFDPNGTTQAVVNDEGQMVIQVPNKRIGRLVQLGVHVEVAERKRAQRRKAQKQSRKRNRRSH